MTLLKGKSGRGSTIGFFQIVGEEAALDFAYMMNMARINRKDGS